MQKKHECSERSERSHFPFSWLARLMALRHRRNHQQDLAATPTFREEREPRAEDALLAARSHVAAKPAAPRLEASTLLCCTRSAQGRVCLTLSGRITATGATPGELRIRITWKNCATIPMQFRVWIDVVTRPWKINYGEGLLRVYLSHLTISSPFNV